MTIHIIGDKKEQAHSTMLCVCTAASSSVWRIFQQMWKLHELLATSAPVTTEDNCMEI